MTGIAIYVEGGGDSRDGKAELRQGFDALLDSQKNAARDRKMGWKLVLCGGRDAAFDAFQRATNTAGSGGLQHAHYARQDAEHAGLGAPPARRDTSSP